MSFDALLGNQRLKDNLRASLGSGRISHFYLISGPLGSGKHTLAGLLAAAILCKGSDRPCCRCEHCRKVLSGVHPDFITVDDPEKKTVPVDLIRWAREDVYIRPNESDRKVYLFPRAQDMGVPGQNALLKILEEPPKHGVFLLLTDNPEKLLPTVRSRCTPLALQPLSDAELRSALLLSHPDSTPDALSAAIHRSGGFLGQAKTLLTQGTELTAQTDSFLDAFLRRDSLALMQLLVSMEKWKRDPLSEEFGRWISVLEGALILRSGMDTPIPKARELSASRTSAELLGAIRSLTTAIEYAQGNISPAAICGWLSWSLR